MTISDDGVITDYQLLCDILLRKYCAQMGIRNRPHIFTSVPEFNKADICDGTKLGQDGVKAMERRGTYCHDCKIIYINSKTNTTTPRIAESIIHELMHHKWWHLPHGKRYDKRIELIMNGKKYK